MSEEKTKGNNATLRDWIEWAESFEETYCINPDTFFDIELVEKTLHIEAVRDEKQKAYKEVIEWIELYEYPKDTPIFDIIPELRKKFMEGGKE